jgi:hypothetical protein
MAPRPPNTSRGSWRSAAVLCGALACQSADEAESSGESSGGAAAAATQATDAAATGVASEGGDDDATLGGEGDGSGDSTGFPEEPPPECGPLTACGVQCTDVMSDPNNCGKCGVSCVIPASEPACSAGLCAVGTCEPGLADCDHDVNNGCESPLPPGQSCPFMCMMGGAETCNLQDDNCDAQCDEGALPGCRQAVHRAVSPTIGHFYTLDANEAMSGDITPEYLNYFYTYAVAVPGLAPLYRCIKGNGKRLYTLSDACEGAGTQEGILGYVAGDGACGAVPLFRLYSGATQEHFYTISEAERDNAVAMYGYAYESVAANVWAGP